MKVLHVIPSLSPRRGGPGVALPVLARSLVRAGVQVEIATTDDDGPGRRDVPLGRPVHDEGVTIRYFPRQMRFYTVSWPLTRWLAHHVAEYDVVHIHALFTYPAVCAAACAWARGVPYVLRPLGTLNEWGMRNRRRYLKAASFTLVERHMLCGASAIHYTSEGEREEARARVRGTPEVVIPLSVTPALPVSKGERDAFLQRYPALRGRVVALFLSRLDAKKGLDLLLPAFAAARRQMPELVLVLAGAGTPEFEQDLRRTVERLGLTGAVTLTGFLAGTARDAAFAAADMFVLPSYSENFGIAPVEAMAAGVPVIVSDRVGVAPDIAAAGAGLVVPCRVEPLAGALGTLARDPALRLRLAAAGRQLVAQRYAPEAVAAQLAALYDRLTAHTPVGMR